MTHQDIEEQEYIVRLILETMGSTPEAHELASRFIDAAVCESRRTYGPEREKDPHWRERVSIHAMAHMLTGIALLARGGALLGTIGNMKSYAEGKDPSALFCQIFMRDLKYFLEPALEQEFASEQLINTRNFARVKGSPKGSPKPSPKGAPTTANKGEKL